MREKKRGRTMRRILSYLRPESGLILVSLLLAALSVVLTLRIPILTGRAIDQIAGPGRVRFDALTQYVFRIILAIAIAAAAQWMMQYIYDLITYRTVQRMRDAAFEQIQRLPLSYLDRHAAGDLISRIVTDAEQFSDGLLLGMSQLFSGVLTILVTIFFMFRIHTGIALFVVIASPASFLIARFVATRTFRMFRAQSVARGALTAYTNEVLENQKLVQAFAREERVQERFDELNAALDVHSRRATFFSSLTNPTTRLMYAMIYAGVTIAGCFVCIASGGAALTIGMLSSFLGYTNQYTRPFNEITAVLTEFQSAIVSAERIFELLDAAPEETFIPGDPAADLLGLQHASSENPTSTPHASAEDSAAMPRSSVRDSVTMPDICSVAHCAVSFDQVSFSYSKEQELIRDLSLRVKKGQRIAIVGPTGSGKTTLINLLMRFYDVDSGAIRMDGVDIRDISRQDVRSRYGMVLQDTWLKSTTVRENIAYGRPDATDEEIRRAAGDAHAAGFIEQLPDGYDTVLSEDGGSLSAGQQQLLCIARVMLDLPEMLILDEATSSIDTRTEHRIQQAFDEMMKGRTTFVVAHRLSTIRNADLILVMDHGHIKEQGTHEELLARGGFYAHLYHASHGR